MPTFIKPGFWREICNPCDGYEGWLNLTDFVNEGGTSGTSGTSGPQGIQGPQGVQGLQGIQGVSGTSGSSGASGDRYRTTSTTEFTLGTSTTLTIGTGLAYTPAQDIVITYDVNNHQVCTVVSYDSGTGALVIGPPITVTGSGTYSNWTVNLEGAAGGDGSSGTSGVNGSSGTSGSQGVQGIQGIAGTNGTSGTSGVNGAVGGYRGSFYDTATQIVSALSTGQPVLVRQTDATCTSGFSVVSNSRITAANTGIYNIAFSFQLYNRGGGGNGTTVEIWLVKNGVAIPDSNTRIAVNTNSPYVVAAWNFFLQMNAGQYVEIYWATDNDHIELQNNTGSMGGPAIPSTIITVNQIG